ncbi:MAG: HAD-IA family hydrolase, partial [Gammaproteobacteria bacterium]
ALQHRKYTLLELHKWFHGFTVSEAVGIAKPQKQIFDVALSTMTKEFNRESVLMVGDSLHHDGHGAKNAGIHFCFVNPSPTLEIPAVIPIKHHITSVATLPHVLGY